MKQVSTGVGVIAWPRGWYIAAWVKPEVHDAVLVQEVRHIAIHLHPVDGHHIAGKDWAQAHTRLTITSRPSIHAENEKASNIKWAAVIAVFTQNGGKGGYIIFMYYYFSKLCILLFIYVLYIYFYGIGSLHFIFAIVQQHNT